jgi:anti-sigma-K factor RskA
MNDMWSAAEVHALSGAYAVDALDPEERARFEQHLAACATCQAEVASLREAASGLAVTAETDPSPELRGRVLAGIKTVRPLPPAAPNNVRSMPLRRRLAAFAAAAAVLGVAGVGTVVWHEATSTDQTLPTAAERVLKAADAQRVTVSLSGKTSASVVRSVAEGKAVLITRNMPAAPADRVYEVWLQTPAGTMVPAGIMDKAGSTTLVLEGDATNATAAGITIEPEGGSPSPTADPIVLFDFEQAT